MLLCLLLPPFPALTPGPISPNQLHSQSLLPLVRGAKVVGNEEQAPHTAHWVPHPFGASGEHPMYRGKPRGRPQERCSAQGAPSLKGLPCPQGAPSLMRETPEG